MKSPFAAGEMKTQIGEEKTGPSKESLFPPEIEA